MKLDYNDYCLNDFLFQGFENFYRANFDMTPEIESSFEQAKEMAKGIYRLDIVDYEGSKAEKGVLGYYEDGKIYLNMNVIDKFDSNYNCKECVIAHELYHHYSPIKSEIAVHLFVEKYLNLEFNPLIIEYVLSKKLNE